MLPIFQTEQKYPYTWNDNVVVGVFEDEYRKEHDIALHFNANASKRELLRKISYYQSFSTDILVVLENIIQITNIEAFTNERKVVLYTENSTITISASKRLLDDLLILS